MLKAGARIEVVRETDDPQAIPQGERGTVVHVSSIGAAVDWDSGRKLGLALPEDRYSVKVVS